ncbi:hypothetical protein [Methylorubrum extorquens]|uniref:hypothetical protein n=2 Tax=Methylobacteriaceae TaxID=119045 RepID=UPI000FE20521|nr:hypothetical protein [Methylorubrum extorquens]
MISGNLQFSCREHATGRIGPSSPGSTMNYRIEIQKIDENGLPLKPLHVFGADTPAEAINLVRNEFASTSPESYPRSAIIFDENQQIILSYTDAVPQKDNEI